jgi:hypothetical protein
MLLALFSGVQDRFNRVFEKIRDRYVEALRGVSIILPEQPNPTRGVT